MYQMVKGLSPPMSSWLLGKLTWHQTFYHVTMAKRVEFTVGHADCSSRRHVA
jgi:hypothetical protein